MTPKEMGQRRLLLGLLGTSIAALTACSKSTPEPEIPSSSPFAIKFRSDGFPILVFTNLGKEAIATGKSFNAGDVANFLTREFAESGISIDPGACSDALIEAYGPNRPDGQSPLFDLVPGTTTYAIDPAGAEMQLPIPPECVLPPTPPQIPNDRQSPRLTLSSNETAEEFNWEARWKQLWVTTGISLSLLSPRFWSNRLNNMIRGQGNLDALVALVVFSGIELSMSAVKGPFQALTLFRDLRNFQQTLKGLGPNHQTTSTSQ